MKKIIRPIIFSLFIISVCAFTTADKWYLFESKAFGFKAEFPVQPIEKVKLLNTAQGDLNLNMFEYVSKKTDAEPELVYLISYMEYPISTINTGDKEKLKEFYKKIVDGLVSKEQGSLVKESIITLEGFEGVESRIEVKDGTQFIKLRMYLIDHKLYMIETVTETKNELNKSINKFMDSFKLLK